MEKIYSRIAIMMLLLVIVFAWFVDCYSLPSKFYNKPVYKVHLRK